jgi:RimJ/RimL family protein N-acetyltransferase
MIDPALIRHAVPERIATVADAAAILGAVHASRAELAPWLDWLTSEYDLAEAVRAQRRAIEYWNAGDSFQWRIWRRALGPIAVEFVGSIDLHSINWDDRTAELGYWLDSRCAGHGYVVEAGREITQVAIGLVGFAHLRIRCHPDNTRSIATAQRLGFRISSVDLDSTVVLVF